MHDLSAHVPDIAGAALLPETIGMLCGLDPRTLYASAMYQSWAVARAMGVACT